MYKNIQVNEIVTVQGEAISSCYVVINDVSVISLKALMAEVRISVYKSKVKYEENPSWVIYPIEFNKFFMIQFNQEFAQGDLFLKVSEVVRSKFIELNPTWLSENIIIEQ